LETIECYANFERRQNNLKEAENIFNSSLASATDESTKAYLTVKLAHLYENVR